MASKGRRMAEEPKERKVQENYNPEQYKYGAYERNLEREEEIKMKNQKKKHKRLRIFLIIILIIVIIISGLVLAGYGFVNGKINKVQKENIDVEEIGINEETSKQLEGYRNIALLGIDSRADDYGLGNRSDCMIIASINEKTNEVKLISVYRDTYLYVTENGTKK